MVKDVCDLAYEGPFSEFLRLYEKNPDPNYRRDRRDYYLLDFPLFSGEISGDDLEATVGFLLEQGADPNAASGKNKATPLVYFMEDGARPELGVDRVLRVTRMLLAAGADPRRCDRDGGDALLPLAMLAGGWMGEEGGLPVARALVEAGADPIHKNRWGQTALAVADTHPHRPAALVRYFEQALAEQGRTGEDPGVGLPAPDNVFRRYRGGDRVLAPDEPDPDEPGSTGRG